MLKTNACRYVCSLVGLIVLNSNVHAVKNIDSVHKYVVGGEDFFISTPEMRARPTAKDSKVFILEGVFHPRNEAAMKAFGEEIKIAASGLTKEQQDIEVTANNVKWAARVNQGNVEGVERSWVGPDNEEKVQAFKSGSTKTKGVDIPSHIKLMILKIYQDCLWQSSSIEAPLYQHKCGGERYKIIREFG